MPVWKRTASLQQIVRHIQCIVYARHAQTLRLPSISLTNPCHGLLVPHTAALRQAELCLLERPSIKASALVAALRKRYAATAAEYPAKNHELDLSYAAAMRNVSHMFPSDHHIASFFADALMNTMPWDYYVEGRAAVGHRLRPAAAEARDVLERLLQAEPTHEGGKLPLATLDASLDAFSHTVLFR